MVDTIKFSEFVDGGDLEPNQTTVGLNDTLTINTRFSNPFPLLAPGTTGDRPAPAANMYFRLRFNYTTELYEYYNSTTASWIQLEAGTDILPLLASHAAGEGASLIGLENQGGVLNKFVQDLANATLVSQTDNGTLVNGVFLYLLSTGIISVTTGTGALASRILTGTTDQIDVANGDGSADPTFSISLTYPGQTSIITLGTIATGTWQATTIDIPYGGTGVTSVTIAPTPTAWAGWDANSNLSANNFLTSFATTATAAAITTLTVASEGIQEFTGITTQTVVMPVTSTLVAGQQYYIINNSTDAVTVESSGANTIQVMDANTSLIITCVDLAGTTAASWESSYITDAGVAPPGAAGTILRSNGAAWVASTSTFADTYAINTILYAGTANTVSGLTATARGVLVSDNSSVPSMLASAGTTGQILQGSTTGTPTWSTPTYPSTSGSAGLILRSNGTNNVYTTSTFADTYTASNLLYSNGTNTVTGLSTANDGLLVTDNTGIPSILAGPGTTGNILQSNAALAPSFSTATYPSIATSTGTVLRADGTNWIHSTATFADTYAVSTLLYASASNAVSGLATANGATLVTGATGVPSWLANPSATGKILSSISGDAPVWSTATFPASAGSAGTILRSDGTNWIASTATFADTYAVSTILYASASNAVTGLAAANRAVLTSGATGVPVMTALATDGQLIIGSTAGAPAAATLSAGTGISITNGSNSITINASGGGLATATISGTSQAAAVNTRYIALNAGQTTVTLPSTYAVGDMVALVGATANTGGWVLTAAGGDTIRALNQTTTAGGSLTSTAQAGESIAIICDVANTSWVTTYFVSSLLTPS